MDSKSWIIALLIVVIVIGGVYAMRLNRHADSEPQGVLGNAAAAISDKIDQASNQAKADASENSANQHMDAVKSNLGINTNNNGQ